MPNKNYRAGRKREYLAIEELRGLGFKTQRGAGSKGIADILALDWNRLRIISVKPHKDKSIGRRELQRIGVGSTVEVIKELWTYRKRTTEFEVETIK